MSSNKLKDKSSECEEKKFFLKYQEDWLKDQSRIKVWEKSRRIGATWTQAYEDVRDAALGRVPVVWFTSADKTAAEEYILYVKDWAKILDFAAKDLGEILIDNDKDLKTYSVEFSNGVRINALSSNPKALRSKEGKIVIDEAAHHDNPDELWKAARPCIMWGYSLRLLSTHNGKETRFYKDIQKIKQGELNWSLHTVTIYDAVRDGIVKKIHEKRGWTPPTHEEEQAWLEQEKEDCSDELTWEQEYLCIATDEGSAFLSYELLNKCERKSDILYLPLTIVKDWLFTKKEVIDNKIPYEHTIGKVIPDGEIERLVEPLKNIILGHYFIGFDVARRVNLSVIWILEKSGALKPPRAIIALENLGFSVQEAILFAFIGFPETARACLDKTGIGEQLAENAIKKFGKKIEAISFTNPAKEELANNLYTSIEAQTFLIPKSEKDFIKKDFHSMKKLTTAGNNTRFDTTRSGKRGKKGESHGDYFWAGALANYAAKETPGDTSVVSRPAKVKNRALEKFTSLSRIHLDNYY